MTHFSWHHAKKKAKEDYFRRLCCYAKSNPDFISQHPNLVKELLNDQLTNKVETKKYINQKFDKIEKYGTIPKPSVVIKRMNRVV